MLTSRIRGALVALFLGATLGWPVTAAAADNLAPVAVDDPGTQCGPNFGGAFPIPEDWGQFDFAGSCSAIANDSDADGTIVGWLIVAGPDHGALQYATNFPGIFGYTADPDFSTPAGDWVSDSFTYRVVDNQGAVSNVATMRFWVAPLNDPPTFTASSNTVFGSSGVPYASAWATNISPGPSNEASQTVHFEVTANSNPGIFTVQPSIAADGTLSFTGGPIVNGSAQVTVIAKDDGGLENYGVAVPHPADDTSDPVTFTIAVSAPVNQSPTANNDTATVLEDSGLNVIQALSNDTDPDQDPLTVVQVTGASKGFAWVNADASALTYTPSPNATGSDSFSYTVSDGHGHTASATVSITITPVNDPPNAVDDGVPTAIAIPRGAGPVAIAVLANDSSAPDTGESITIVSVTQGSRGTVAIGPTGTSLTYDPTGQLTGFDSFTYTISDGNGGFDTATVFVTISKARPRR